MLSMVSAYHAGAHSLSCVRLFETPWTIAGQAHLSIGFWGQEYWSALPFPPPGDLPDPGVKPDSPALAGSFFTRVMWEAAPNGTPS